MPWSSLLNQHKLGGVTSRICFHKCWNRQFKLRSVGFLVKIIFACVVAYLVVCYVLFLQHYKNNLKAVKAHCDEKFQSHCLNLLRWDSIPLNAVWAICFLWMSYTLCGCFSLGLSLMCGNKMQERAKKNDKRSLLLKLISIRLFFQRWDKQESLGQESEQIS